MVRARREPKCLAIFKGKSCKIHINFWNVFEWRRETIGNRTTRQKSRVTVFSFQACFVRNNNGLTTRKKKNKKNSSVNQQDLIGKNNLSITLQYRNSCRNTSVYRLQWGDHTYNNNENRINIFSLTLKKISSKLF